MSSIRPYRPSDMNDVIDICVRTGDGGGDATGKFSRDTLLPDVYAVPYIRHDPGLAWIVDDGERAIGYLVATADTRDFARWFADAWWPEVAGRYLPSTSETPGERGLIESASNPARMLVSDVDAYPAHLHIDLLPATQGQGLGRRLIDTLVAELRERGVTGLHLTAGATNVGAIAFYERVGFHELERDDGSVTFGMTL
ncbi:GNAT family N-acetyltransferase [Paramicrobacterium chengjingii]|uniref:GNAT family N-acetyltransferase n=1 Tax=Paramicrobacterium chengjingii TaxID=2769067 RepID=A0ABX6YG15_9MICO|nr:GNAT family N-acetyltransferase [Microbacterium chengjingii]QPZ37549.1 GNAT family N-acetyltransferase [Microbacterium chengjingii]